MLPKRLGFLRSLLLILSFIVLFSFPIIAETKTLDKLDPLFRAQQLLKNAEDAHAKSIKEMVKVTPAVFIDQTKIANRVRVNLSDLKASDLRAARLDYHDLSGIDLSNKDLREASFIGADLSNADLSGANLTGANLSGAQLDDADLRGARLDATYAPSASFKKSKLDRIQMEGAYWPYVNLDSASIIEAVVSRSNFNGAEFVNTLVHKSKFDSTVFWGTKFDSANIVTAEFTNCQFVATAIINSKIFDSKFSECLFHKQIVARLMAVENSISKSHFGHRNDTLYDFDVISKEWLNEITMLSMGVFWRDESSVHYPKKDPFKFDNSTLEQVFIKVSSTYLTRILQSHHFWETFYNMNYIQNMTNAISKDLTNIDVLNHGETIVFELGPDYSLVGHFKGSLNDYFELMVRQNPSIAGQRDIYEREFKEEFKRLRSRRPGSSAPTTADSNASASEGPFAELPFIPLLDFDLNLCMVTRCIERRFETRIFDNFFSIKHELRVKTYAQAAAIVADRQDTILRVNKNLGANLIVTSYYRPATEPSQTVNHALGAIDFSLTKAGLQNDPQAKRELAENFSSELGSDHLVILEEVYWVEKGQTIHSASKKLRKRAINRLAANAANPLKFPGAPPPNLPTYTDAIPGEDATIVQINTGFINGKRVYSRWKSPHATAQHLHVQPKRFGKETPYWFRQFLNNRYKVEKEKNFDTLSQELKEVLRPFYPESLVPESKPK